MTDLEKFQNKRKESIVETIGSTFWRGMEDLWQAMAWSGKKTKNTWSKTSDDQISVDLDKFENERIKGKK